MKVASVGVALQLVALLAATVMAQPNGAGQRGGDGGYVVGGGTASAFTRLATAVANLGLSADQKTKFTALKTEYAPKFKALRDKQDKILTAEQRKARDEAMKAALAAPQAPQAQRREAFAKVRAAVKLSDDQQKQQTEVMQEVRKLLEEVRPKINAILTEEQKTKLRESLGRRPGAAKT